MDLSGRTALVTGGGTGIGRATAALLLGRGANVFLVARRHDVLAETAAALDPEGARTGFRPADVRDAAQVDAAVAAASERFGGLHVLVNAAGWVPDWTPVHETADETWAAALDINLTGAFRATRAALPLLVDTRGAIVNVGSISAHKAANSVAGYAAAKAGLLALTRSVAAEYGWQGVRCNCVVPSWVETPMTAGFLEDPATRADVAGRHALQRCASPAEIARTIVFLASDDASFITGAAIAADGGMGAL